jgi:prevent-host-death family protein
MSKATISQLKNHLPEMVHTVEGGQDLHITRHGKPVAVIVSLARYQQAFSSGKGIFNAVQRWRHQFPDADGFSDEELEQLRDKTAHTNSVVWG